MAVILKTDQGTFSWVNGTCVWDGDGVVGSPADAPISAIVALATLLIDSASVAAAGCGGGNVAGAVGSLGFALAIGQVGSAMSDLDYLIGCYMAGIAVYE